MGFSFSGIREELDSKELGKLYRRLQADCRYLAPFADWKAMRGLLNLLARRRVIDWEEKRIFDATLIAGKTLKEIARPGEYERLKYRRKNALKAIRVYLLRILKKDVS